MKNMPLLHEGKSKALPGHHRDKSMPEAVLPRAEALPTKSAGASPLPLGDCVCEGGCPRCQGIAQPKPIIGQANNQYEAEADRMADLATHPLTPGQSFLPISDMASDGSSNTQKTNDYLPLTRADEGAITPQERYVDFLPINGPINGDPLPPSVRSFYETRLDHNFQAVRIHTDHRAQAAASDLKAQAFTSGKDIYFASDRYSPQTPEGSSLLAHELVHVIQQEHIPGQSPSKMAPRCIQKKEDWDFTRKDYGKLIKKGKLYIASGAEWFPKKLQENLLATLNKLLDPKLKPSATEGINPQDFYHGHVAVPRDYTWPVELTQARDEYNKQQEELYSKALGGESFNPVTKKNLPAFKKAVQDLLPYAKKFVEELIKAPGAACIYHTFETESSRPKGMKPRDPRRNWITPLDTNEPQQLKTAENEPIGPYYVPFSFGFLVDEKGGVHIRPGSIKELPTITGIV